MADIILLAGLSGAGKTRVYDTILPVLSQRYDVTSLDDRFFLDRQVVADVRGNFPVDGQPVAGEHCILFAYRGPGKFEKQLTDGRLLNQAHYDMLWEMQRFSEGKRLGHRNGNEIMVVQWAYGPDGEYDGREPLFQSGSHMVRWLKEFNMVDSVVVLDLQASLATRLERNYQRDAPIPTDEFCRLFPDAGHLTEQDVVDLGDRYRFIVNDGISHKHLESLIYMRLGDFILPSLSVEMQDINEERYRRGTEMM